MGDRELRPPAPAPCGSCPYRRDVPSGVWHRSEYEKLPQFDQPTPLQPIGVFLCHQVDGRICAGWAGCHDMTHSLGVRLALLDGRLEPDEADALYDYTTPVPLFASGREAAEHGMADLDHQSPAAIRVAGKILARRRTKTQGDDPMTPHDAQNLAHGGRGAAPGPYGTTQPLSGAQTGGLGDTLRAWADAGDNAAAYKALHKAADQADRLERERGEARAQVERAWAEGYEVGYEDQRYRDTTKPRPENPYRAALAGTEGGL